ncbi:SH3 and multiple ankyrin repeat domains protein 2 [Galemys pyrenaicus]|uniref:SH3 and multiple ankyrin repeat domains protein 2 n=1 Tax=Galemys pyrenaicus TaxID=202257 RepID=A0A8J6AKA9_GALPY|nr:SH3 and multiple ankyrin repeat domains protein 2 [Galemys pyrenaicus]
MTGYNNGRYPRNSLYSDCIVTEKTVVLQKKDNEGFGFVLRGAKADTPIEEFTPTPAFPALQYLESVDEGGVAWQAGLRTGDFLIEVGTVRRQPGGGSAGSRWAVRGSSAGCAARVPAVSASPRLARAGRCRGAGRGGRRRAVEQGLPAGAVVVMRAGARRWAPGAGLRGAAVVVTSPVRAGGLGAWQEGDGLLPGGDLRSVRRGRSAWAASRRAACGARPWPCERPRPV